MKLKTYKELSLLRTFDERFRYLKLNGQVGIDTFGFDRVFNQKFYKSKEWKDIRHFVITRDNACDLGVDGFDIYGRILIHHMNPISVTDIEQVTDILLDPNYLIAVSHETHNAIHYGNADILQRNKFVERRPGDTCPWKKGII